MDLSFVSVEKEEMKKRENTRETPQKRQKHLIFYDISNVWGDPTSMRRAFPASPASAHENHICPLETISRRGRVSKHKLNQLIHPIRALCFTTLSIHLCGSSSQTAAAVTYMLAGTYHSLFHDVCAWWCLYSGMERDYTGAGMKGPLHFKSEDLMICELD